MKKMIIYFLTLIVSASVFSQKIDPALQLTKQDYLQKSKNQKTTGWILLGAGTTAIITGIIIDNAHIRQREQSFTGGIIEVSGILCGLTSIPFFIASGKNKRKSNSISLNIQKTPQIKDNSLTSISIPSLAYKMNF